MNLRKHFIKIARMTQPVLKKHVAKKLRNMGKAVSVGDGFVYAPGEFPVLLCAHMDTVHKNIPNVINDKDGIISSPNGIGGDDRCGIVMCFEILKHVNCHVAFFEDEEIGGVGSAKFAKTDICKGLDIRYVIELDRMNSNDAVFYDCDNPEFTKFITKEFWVKNTGSFTDICNICPEIGVAGVNLSCGYYHQHTKNESVVVAEMEKATNEVIRLLSRTDVNKTFEYVEKTYTGKWATYYGGNYDYNYDIPVFDRDEYKVTYVFEYDFHGEYKVAFVNAFTEEEAFMDFMINHPKVCYNDIVTFYPSYDYKNL